jgi:hypothetical protein
MCGLRDGIGVVHRSFHGIALSVELWLIAPTGACLSVGRGERQIASQQNFDGRPTDADGFGELMEMAEK